MPAERSPDEIRGYLKQLFEASFDEGPRALLRLRAEFLGIQPPAPDADHPDPQEMLARRDELESRLVALRRTFWTSDLGELRQELQVLDAELFPDLHDAILKLKRTAKFRAQFPQLVQHQDFQADLFQAFKRIVILSPKESAPIKEQLLTRIRREGIRPDVARMVGAIRDEFPELYELEPQWLELIARG